MGDSANPFEACTDTLLTDADLVTENTGVESMPVGSVVEVTTVADDISSGVLVVFVVEQTTV